MNGTTITPHEIPGRVLIEELPGGGLRWDNRNGTFTVEIPLSGEPSLSIPIIAKDGRFEAAGSRLLAEFQLDGKAIYRPTDASDQWVSLKAHGIGYDMPLDDVRLIAPASPRFAPSIASGKLSLAESFLGVPARYDASDGAVAKLLTLDSAFLGAIPKTAKTVQFVWAAETAGLPRIASALQGVILGIDGTPMRLRLEPIEARDAAWAYCPGRTEYRNGYVIGSVDAVWLRNAQAPVTIDPTVNSDVPTADLSGGVVMTMPPYTFAPQKLFEKITLPSVAGGTVTQGLIYNKTSEKLANVSVDAFVTQEVAWTEASNAATMDALTLGTLLSTTSVNADETWFSWNVTGDATKGIIKAYADNATAVTIILRSAVGTVAVISNVNALGGSFGAPAQVTFYDRTGGANAPYLAVTYTAADTRTPKPAFAIGGIKQF